MTYHTSNEEHPIDIVNIASLEGRVKERMEAGAFGYIRGGSEDEWTMKENTTSFNTKKIMPRILRGIDSADLHTSVFGIELDTRLSKRHQRPKDWHMKKGKLIQLKG